MINDKSTELQITDKWIHELSLLFWILFEEADCLLSDS